MYAGRVLAVLDRSITVPAMIKFLKQENKELKKNIITIFGQLRMSELIPSLVEMFDEEDFVEDVLKVLVGYRDPSMVPVFIRLLKEGNSLFVKYSISGLQGIGNSAASKVVKLLDDEGVKVRRNAIFILKSIATNNEIPELIKALHDTDEDVCGMAARILGVLRAEGAVTHLIDAMLKDRSKLQFNQASWALYHIGTPAVPFLLKLLRGNSHRGKVYAAWVLAHIGTPKGY